MMIFNLFLFHLFVMYLFVHVYNLQSYKAHSLPQKGFRVYLHYNDVLKRSFQVRVLLNTSLIKRAKRLAEVS